MVVQMSWWPTRVFTSIREEIAKQKGFVSDLGNYNVQQWVEFFHMKASTAQALVEEIRPFYRQHNGTSLFDSDFKLSMLTVKIMMVVHVFVGRGRPQVHLQEQVLMLLHFVAYKGKYGLLFDKFGITRSCYFTCIEEMMAIVTQDLLGKHIVWPNCDW